MSSQPKPRAIREGPEPPVKSKRMLLAESKILAGQTETITVSDFRNAPGDILQQVQMGKVFNITKAGKLIAVLQAPEPNAFELGAACRAVANLRGEKHGK